jgi:hypothetical protein
MGIIDVLQEYNARKAMESRYRRLQSPMQLSASCVPPNAYGQRFVKFFDEFTTREPKTNSGEEGIEIDNNEKSWPLSV